MPLHNAALWCEENDPEMNVVNLIGHPFSAKDEGVHTLADTSPRRRYTGNSYGQSTYQEEDEVTETFTMCGYHWDKRNPFQTPRKSLSASVDKDTKVE